MTNLKVVNQLDPDDWREFVDSHLEGNIFHTPEMFEVFSRTQGYKPMLWAGIGAQGQINVLHLPVQITLKGGIFYFLTTRNVNFGSILAEENQQGKEALSAVLEKYNQQVSWAVLFTELRNVCDVCDFQEVFAEHGYTYEPHLNYFLDLARTPDEILSSFGKQTRRKIRTNIKRGDVVIRGITDPALLPVFYEIIQKTYSNARIPLADISLFQAAFDVLMPKKMVRFTMAFVGDVPVSAIVCLLYKDVMFGWYMGVDRAYGKFYPNEYIVWDAMKWGAENSYTVLDFGGAGNPDEDSGVRDFKMKFRGDLCELGRNCCIHAPIRRKICGPMYQFSRVLFQILGSVPNIRLAQRRS